MPFVSKSRFLPYTLESSFSLVTSSISFCISLPPFLNSLIVPIGIKFLLGFATDIVVPMITISKYVSFVGSLTLAFGAVFQLPLAILFLTKIGVVTPQFLSNKRKHAVVFIFIAAATLTPPDVITQSLMALPLLLLYELGVIFSKLAYRPI